MILESKFRSTEKCVVTRWTINDDNGYSVLSFDGQTCVIGWLTKTTKRGWTFELFSIYTGKPEVWFVGREFYQEVEE